MKIVKGCVLIFLLFLSTVSLSQQPIHKVSLTREDYLEKSRKQKKASFILAGAGVASAITSIIYGLNDGLFNKKVNDVSGIFVGIGLACVTAAIPLRFASKRNYRKAAANFIYPKVPSAKQVGIFAKAYPALTLKVDL